MEKMKTILIIFIFLAIIFLMTYPLCLNVSDQVPGFFSSDESLAPLWHSWFNNYAFRHNLSVKYTDLLAYPFGIEFYKNTPIFYVYFIITYILGVFTNPALTYNLQILSNFLLNALCVYFLVFYLSNNRLCALFSGLVFAFCPYAFMRSWQHIGETYLWPIPLVLLAAISLKAVPSKRNKVFYVLALILVTLNGNAIYYVPVILAIFLAYLFLNYVRYKVFRKDMALYIKNLILLSIIAAVILLVQMHTVIFNTLISKNTTASAQNIYHRPFEDLFMQSAKPLSYFLPSALHPVFGKFTEHFVGSQLYGASFTEHTLYIGWVPLILAFVAFRKWRKGRKSQDAALIQKDKFYFTENFYICFFFILAISAWFFSQPPWWQFGKLRIYMPSFFMYNILPMFRAYCRFGIVLMFAVAVLAGFGLKFFLERFKSGKIKIAVFLLCCGLVLFEFWNWPPYKVIDISRVPEVYYWLKAQPENIVIAEYPMDVVGPNDFYKFYQTKHEKKIINGTIPGTYPHKVAKSINRLSAPETAATLRWLGVKCVLVHKDDYLKTGLIDDQEDLVAIHRNPGLKFIKSFPAQECPNPKIRCMQKTGQVDVYEVLAQPKPPNIKEE